MNALVRPGRHLALAVRSSTQTGAIDKLLLLRGESELRFDLNNRHAAVRLGVVLHLEIKYSVSLM